MKETILICILCSLLYLLGFATCYLEHKEPNKQDNTKLIKKCFELIETNKLQYDMLKEHYKGDVRLQLQIGKDSITDFITWHDKLKHRVDTKKILKQWKNEHN